MREIKPFHELTEAEFNEICEEKMTWAECAEKYPQPKWCSYPDAVCGVMGCWSLMSSKVTDESYCKTCDCYLKGK